jgi:hypothetical protein
MEKSYTVAHSRIVTALAAIVCVFGLANSDARATLDSQGDNGLSVLSLDVGDSSALSIGDHSFVVTVANSDGSSGDPTLASFADDGSGVLSVDPAVTDNGDGTFSLHVSALTEGAATITWSYNGDTGSVTFSVLSAMPVNREPEPGTDSVPN